MNEKVVFLFAFILVCSTVKAGPYYPFYRPYGAINSYYYSGATPLTAPVAPVAPLAAAAPTVLGGYYAYAAGNALAYPGYSYGYGYPYAGAYSGAYPGYPYLKK